jgi:hypothetical protein
LQTNDSRPCCARQFSDLFVFDFIIDTSSGVFFQPCEIVLLDRRNFCAFAGITIAQFILGPAGT